VNAEATHSDAFSWGVGARQAIYAYDCNFTSAAGSGIYLHNFPASSHAADPSPAIMVFDNCTATGAGSNPGLRMLEEYSQQADTFIWNGGKIKGGTTAAADISIDYLSGVTLSSWVGLIDPTAGTSTSAAGIGISRGVAAAMPQPLAASAMMNSYHYPDHRGLVRTLSVGPAADTVLRTVAASRVFYIPFTVSGAVKLRTWLSVCGVAAGTMTVGVYLDRAGVPLNGINFSNPATLAAGKVWQDLDRYLYPGAKYWPGVVVSDATATVAASTLTGVLAGVRYQDSATLPNPAGATTVLPAGEAVPVVTLTTN
jgi:hypothetical protein